MDDARFDSLTRGLGAAVNRRAALKGLLGLGAASVGIGRLADGADAARRGYSGPKLPTPAPDPCGCGPNTTCIGGVCFASCIGCACGSCTLVPGRGLFCTEADYATSGSCNGICEAEYGCDGGNICMKPCSI